MVSQESIIAMGVCTVLYCTQIVSFWSLGRIQRTYGSYEAQQRAHAIHEACRSKNETKRRASVRSTRSSSPPWTRKSVKPIIHTLGGCPSSSDILRIDLNTRRRSRERRGWRTRLDALRPIQVHNNSGEWRNNRSRSKECMMDLSLVYGRYGT
jgi:hypothetical protein